MSDLNLNKLLDEYCVNAWSDEAKLMLIEVVLTGTPLSDVADCLSMSSTSVRRAFDRALSGINVRVPHDKYDIHSIRHRKSGILDSINRIRAARIKAKEFPPRLQDSAFKLIAAGYSISKDSTV